MEEKIPLVSVIMPVYNTEAYIENSILSVLGQKYRNFEYIIINDGSTDGSSAICEKYEALDKRIVYVNSPNKGASSARNLGITYAKGEWISFIDSDDQWVSGKLNEVMHSVKQADSDILILNSFNLYDDGTLMKTECPPYIKPGVTIYPINEIYEHLIKNGNLQEQAGTHIVKRDFILKNSLYFEEGLLGEDTEWMLRALRLVQIVAVSDIYLQIYTSGRPGAITRTTTTKNVQHLIDIINKSIAFYNLYPNSSLRKYELAHCSYLWSTALGLFSYVAQEDKHLIKSYLKKIRKQLDIYSHPKSKLVGLVYKIFGFDLTSMLLAEYIKLHRKNIVNRKIRVKNI